jgi:hypothetical protein
LAFHANSVRIFLSRCWRKRPRPLHKCGRPWTPITAPINEPCPYLYTININTPCLITAIFLFNPHLGGGNRGNASHRIYREAKHSRTTATVQYTVHHRTGI